MKRLYPFLALTAFSLSANAADLTIMAGYQFNSDFEVSTDSSMPNAPKTDVGIKDGASIGLAMDFIFNENSNQRFGFNVSRQQTDFDLNDTLSNTGIDVTHVHFTGTNYYPNGKFEPYIMAGVGASFFSPDDSTLDNETNFSMQIGGGTNYRFTDNLLLRLDLRWTGTFFDSSSAIFCSGGCIISFSSSTYSQVQANVGLMFRF